MEKGAASTGIILLLAGINFVNWLDFFLVGPLGPDFAKALDISVSQLGIVTGGYSLAAALAALAGSLFLDSFGRRAALTVCMFGLVTGTALGGCSLGLGTIVAARVIAGLFAGPILGLCYALIADVVPDERRGAAFSAMTGTFALAQVIGVPTSLELARVGSWRTPFFVVAAMGAAVAVIAMFRLPPLAQQGLARPGVLRFWAQPTMVVSLMMTAALMMQVFLLSPNIASYVQFNMGMPRSELSLMYFFGGVASLVGSRAGLLVDRIGGSIVMLIGTAIATVVYLTWFLLPVGQVPVVVFFCGFTLAQAIRLVTHHTLASKVPEPLERGRYLSMQTAVQHSALAAGGFVSARLLSEGPGMRLIGMPKVALLAIVVSACVAPLAWAVHRRTAIKSAAH